MVDQLGISIRVVGKQLGKLAPLVDIDLASKVLGDKHLAVGIIQVGKLLEHKHLEDMYLVVGISKLHQLGEGRCMVIELKLDQQAEFHEFRGGVLRDGDDGFHIVHFCIF